MTKTTSLITPAEAAPILGLGAPGVRYLIRAGRLRAARYGSCWLIEPADLKKIRYGKPGRPKPKAG